MKNLFIFITSAILLISCSKQGGEYKNKYTLIPTNDSITIKIDRTSRNLSYHIQYFEKDTTEYLALNNFENNSIDIYDLKNQSLMKRIKIKYEGNEAFGELTAFLIYDFDSIALISTRPARIGLTDTTGHIFKKIPYDKDIKNRAVHASIPWGGQRPFKIGNTIYLGQVYSAREANGIMTSTGQKNSRISININLESNECIAPELLYPEDLVGKDIKALSISRVLGFKNCFIYHFSYLKSLFISKDYAHWEKVPLESNYELKMVENAKSDLKSGVNDLLIHDMVQDIYFDEYRKFYYVIIRKREDKIVKDNAPNIKLLYPDCFILILDRNLHHMGEVTFPPNTYSFKMIFVNRRGIYISEDHVNNSSFNEDYMRFKLFTPEKIK